MTSVRFFFCDFKKLLRKMEATSSMVKKGSNMLVYGVDWKAPNFKLSFSITKNLDPAIAQLQIPSRYY